MTSYQDNKGQTHVFITTDVGKALDKIQFPFRIESLNKLGVKGLNLGIIKSILKYRPKHQYSNWRNDQEYVCYDLEQHRDAVLSLLFDKLLAVLARALNQDREKRTFK